MNKNNKTPLYVIVTDERWDAVGEQTARNKWLTQLLTKLGGVNDTTAPGTYIFDARWKFFKLEVSLLPTNDVI